MRFESISIGPGDDPAVIRFHPKLTIVCGMAAPERSEMFELILGALSGNVPDIRDVRYVDDHGRAISLAREASGVRCIDEAGAEAPSPLTLFGLDPGSLRRLMLIEAPDIGLVPAGPSDNEAPELREARATLAAMESEVAQALEIKARVDALRAEVAAIDERIRQGQEGGNKRRYGRLLADLERVRAEAASIRGGSVVADADRRFVAAAGDVRQLAAQWREVEAGAAAERERWGARERLDPRTLAEALKTPDTVPAELDGLAAAYEAAAARRSALNEQLKSLSSDHLAEPSHPTIVRLAHADQDLVWNTAREALQAAEHLEGQSVALGGLEAEGVEALAVSDIEAAHDAVDRAERLVDDRFVPGAAAMAVGVLIATLGAITSPFVSVGGAAVVLIAGLCALGVPRRILATARRHEEEVLERAGVPSYIGFQYRRLEVTINPSATEPLELAALEYRRAMAAWRGLAGDLAPAEALALEAETRAYAAAMSGLRGAADQIAQVRSELVDEAEPALSRARQQLIDACTPYGITDPSLAVDLVRHQASTSSVARLQQEVEAAEATAAEVRARLEGRLAELGFSGADLAECVDAFDHARTDAQRREKARRTARPADEVEADLGRLEALARAEHRPEWGNEVVAEDLEEPDLDDLACQRQLALAEYTDADRLVPDIDRLVDRREAMQRRVTVLVERFGDRPAGTIDSSDLEQLLLARLAAARRVGPLGETVPLVLNDPFEQVHGDRKWAILETVERLAGSLQLTYLTDDVDTIVWGRRRAAAGAVSLLEPVTEAAAS